MGRDVRFIMVNDDEAFGAEMRALLRDIGSNKVVAEVDDTSLLGHAVSQFSFDVLLVNLDPNPEATLRIIRETIRSERSYVVFAVSGSTDGRLILQAMRDGVREFLPRPIDQSALAEAIEKIAELHQDGKTIGKLITVTGASGGVGGTMIATNLAVELAVLSKKRVILVDLDYRFGQIATFLDVEPRYTIGDLAASPEQLDPTVVGKALVEHSSGVKILARPESLDQADTLTAASCMGVLTSLLEMSDFVVADGPSRLDPKAKSVLDISDVSLLVTYLLVPSVRNAARIVDALRGEGYDLNQMRLVCNRVGSQTGQLSVQDVTETVNLRAFASIPDDWATVSGAINLGEPISAQGGKTKVCQIIQSMAERLSESGAMVVEQDQKKGLIGRIFAAT